MIYAVQKHSDFKLYGRFENEKVFESLTKKIAPTVKEKWLIINPKHTNDIDEMTEIVTQEMVDSFPDYDDFTDEVFICYETSMVSG